MKKIFTLLLAITSTAFISRAQNNSLSFDGVDDYVDISSVGNSYGNSIITYEAWVNPTNTSGDHAIICRGNSANNKGVTFGVSNGQFWIGGNDGDQWNNSYIGNVPLNTWTHLAAVYDQTTGNIEVYINGIFVTQVNHQFDINDSDYATHIGRNQIGFIQWFSGRIDEVRIWNVARTQSQIQDDMNSSGCGDQTGLVAYYTFNEGTAGGNNSGVTTLDDVTSNNNDGTLVNFALSGASSNWIAGAPGLSSNAKITALGNLDICTTGFVNLRATPGTNYIYQWILNDANIRGATNRVYSAKSIGSYQVSVTNGAGCKSVSKVTTVYSSCRLEQNEEQLFNLFPNPSIGTFNLDLTTGNGENAEARIEVLNALGQIIFSDNGQLSQGRLQKEIKLNNKPAGIYLVKVIADNKTFTSQITLQR